MDKNAYDLACAEYFLNLIEKQDANENVYEIIKKHFLDTNKNEVFIFIEKMLNSIFEGKYEYNELTTIIFSEFEKLNLFNYFSSLEEFNNMFSLRKEYINPKEIFDYAKIQENENFKYGIYHALLQFLLRKNIIYGEKDLIKNILNELKGFTTNIYSYIYQILMYYIYFRK